MKRRRSDSAPLICEENLNGLLGPLKTRSVAKSIGYSANTSITKGYELIEPLRSRENAENSPLLRLPAEIRIKIFEYVLGGNTIHIESLSQTACVALRKHDIWIGLGLYNGLCQASESEEEMYERFQDPSQDNKNQTPFYVSKRGQDLGHNYYVEPWSTRHSRCGEEPNPRRI